VTALQNVRTVANYRLPSTDAVFTMLRWIEGRLGSRLPQDTVVSRSRCNSDAKQRPDSPRRRSTTNLLATAVCTITEKNLNTTKPPPTIPNGHTTDTVAEWTPPTIPNGHTTDTVAEWTYPTILQSRYKYTMYIYIRYIMYILKSPTSTPLKLWQSKPLSQSPTSAPTFTPPIPGPRSQCPQWFELTMYTFYLLYATTVLRESVKTNFVFYAI